MKISKYLRYILKDFFTAYGCLMVITAIFLSIYSRETISTSLFFQIMLVASSYTFFKFAFANKYELEKKAQAISFAICFILADVMILIWLLLFSPGRIFDKDLILIYFIIIVIVKGAVYAMMYVDGKVQTKQLNEKLKEHNSGRNE